MNRVTTNDSDGNKIILQTIMGIRINNLKKKTREPFDSKQICTNTSYIL